MARPIENTYKFGYTTGYVVRKTVQIQTTG